MARRVVWARHSCDAASARLTHVERHAPSPTVLVRFTNEENISGKSQVKSSVQRGIKQSILDQYPGLEEEIEELLPKKEPLFVAKWCAPAALPACSRPPFGERRARG